MKVLPLDSAACALAWEQVTGALFELTPRIEAIRDGLALFEVPSRDPQRQALKSLVRSWDACCGVAQSRAIAELAAYTAVPGRVQRVRSGSEKGFLHAVPVGVLSEVGVSSSTIERLGWFGLRTIGALQAVSRRQLCEQFEQGVLLARFAEAGASSGERRPVASWVPAPVVEARLVFEQAATQPCEWEAGLVETLRRVCELLNGYSAGRLSVAMETCRGRLAASRLLREPTASARALQEPAQALLGSLLGPEVAIHSLEVQLGSLSSRVGQSELFTTTKRREEELHTVLRGIERRYAGAVQRLQARDLHAPLPEERFTRVPIEFAPALPGRSSAVPGRLATRTKAAVPRRLRPSRVAKSW